MGDELYHKMDAALAALPRPVDREDVLKAARVTLPPTEFHQFSKWMQSNGPTLLGKLNG